MKKILKDGHEIYLLEPYDTLTGMYQLKNILTIQLV